MAATQFDKSMGTISAECIAVRMRMLNRVVTRIYDDALRPLGLKVSQMNILVATARLGTACPADVCRHLHLETSTLSRNAERMKAHGWLEVVPTDDGRAQPFRLAAAGRKLLEKAVPAWKQAQQRARQILGDEIVQLLDGATRRVNESAGV